MLHNDISQVSSYSHFSPQCFCPLFAQFFCALESSNNQLVEHAWTVAKVKPQTSGAFLGEKYRDMDYPPQKKTISDHDLPIRNGKIMKNPMKNPHFKR